MTAHASVRDLRNRFTEVRRRLEAEGEVLVTERGKPRYRLSLYTLKPEKVPPAVDYWARLNSYQPKPITRSQSQKLHAENRGER